MKTLHSSRNEIKMAAENFNINLEGKKNRQNIERLSNLQKENPLNWKLGTEFSA